MFAAAKRFLRLLVPPSLRREWRLRTGWQWLRGDYPDWAAARAASAGYDTPAELERYAAAARRAEACPGAWDRDGVVFETPASHAPLLAALAEAARRHPTGFDVIDFGGALGSTWRQHRSALAACRVRRWWVVEQPAWVEAGRREFAHDGLDFAATLAEASRRPASEVLLLSSVLPYLEAPHALIDDVIRRPFSALIIDRTPFWRGGRDRLTVQHTPPQYGGGSYPCWVFDRERLLAPLHAEYRLAAEWPGFDDLAAWVRYRGICFTRSNAG
ncbi:MAG TPA: methyltransferase, TIGR04325 family [Opitutaceae bacterium]|nr:methyltransferase, TIGR04325 family [Opitutaceae bacterium]